MVNLFLCSLPFDLVVSYTVDGVGYSQSGGNSSGSVPGVSASVAAGVRDVKILTLAVQKGVNHWGFDHWELGGNLQGLPCTPVIEGTAEFTFDFEQDTNVIAVFKVSSVDSETGFVGCPFCDDAMVERIGETNMFYCPSCHKKFSAEGYAFGTERPPL